MLLPGQHHDMVGVVPLIHDVHFDALIADKEFRAIATRYDKTDTSYAAKWNLVATVIAAR